MPGNGQRRWGWHRLRRTWAERILDGISVRDTDLVLDLGSGTGALTVPMAARGARVIAVELHAGRASRLRDAVAGHDRVTVVQGDMLEVPLPHRPFRVVANPPYAAAAALVRRLTGRDSALRRADLVVPRWMANRYASAPPSGFTAEVGAHVPARAFDPPPRDDSAVLVLRRRRAPQGRRRSRRR
ncbi:rRNA adenine N(6)-methyltransferase family protein [Occultella kanbiaonis]|uniref:rRNA adenine N(6)-methyltransferase family protein n=1 Tax=Occultella kanbiaonis TaxID=2675754 RepID=UPI0013D575B4|nr:rRNA adenine N(6)-methyltransferase family protein [Occultella kanbiaonis]